VSALIHIATAQADLPRTRVSQLLGIGRATLYRHLRAEPPLDRDVVVRDRIQHIALEMPAYGYRRITAQLHRDQLYVNHKRVLRLMREDNLLCLRTRPFVRTTDADHGYAVYPNLVPRLEVSGLNQLWIADITYVRLRCEFIYLAVVLDAFSRRCIGWCLERHLQTELTLAALRMALASRAVGPGLVHHSDRGGQYAAHAYTDLLTAHGIQISMSRRGTPYDNAQAESFMKTLKYEEVHVNDYACLEEARASIGHFLEEVYNQKRLHSALGYCPPAEFEATINHRTSP
jgi:putative transposase